MGARGENDFKLVPMNLEKNLRKEIQKKNGKGAGAAGPTSPPFRPSERPGLLPPPPLSRARGRASSQPASAMWRPYVGEERAAAGYLHPPGRDAGSGSQATPSTLSRAPLPPPPSARAAQPQQLCRSAIAGAAPLLTAGHPVAKPRHRNHRRVRHR